ncbi:glyoxalase/bleomycin resistance protein/dioxygenase [Flammula alnicola]|nr:glyoxalase/bleomycin resistance protein/dioxygenase [Flammula alnicola]
MVLHHVQFVSSSLSEAKKFYLAALAPLGYEQFYEVEGTVVGLGVKGVPDFWLRNVKGPDDPPTKGLHLAFKAESREVVDKFYEAALKAGAKDNGPPGVRDYVPGYYAAFVLDIEGNNIEVMHL